MPSRSVHSAPYALYLEWCPLIIKLLYWCWSSRCYSTVTNGGTGMKGLREALLFVALLECLYAVGALQPHEPIPLPVHT